MNNQTMIISNRITFWASMTFLMAAFTCGVLHRASSVELPVVITGWILPVFPAAAVGYLTNWLAIQLLFRPYRLVRWFGGGSGNDPQKPGYLSRHTGK